jgi:hypothetical protein
MNVHFMTAYLAGHYDSNDALYEPHMSTLAFVKTIKHDRVKSRRRLLGLEMTLENRENVLDLFGAWAALTLTDMIGNFCLVPIPGSKVDVTVPQGQQDVGGRSRPPLDMARAICSALEGRAHISDILRFKTSHAAVHGGQRLSAGELSGQYVCLSPPGPGTVVFVDDVYTTGAHLKAARDFLSIKTRGQNFIGLCGARTVKKYVANPFPYEDVAKI